MAQPALVWTNVESSNVKRIAFHDGSKNLCVEFNNGGLYAYHGVDSNTYVSLVHAESVGKYLNSVVKALYPYTKYNDEHEFISSLGEEESSFLFDMQEDD